MTTTRLWLWSAANEWRRVDVDPDTDELEVVDSGDLNDFGYFESGVTAGAVDAAGHGYINRVDGTTFEPNLLQLRPAPLVVAAGDSFHPLDRTNMKVRGNYLYTLGRTIGATEVYLERTLIAPPDGVVERWEVGTPDLFRGLAISDDGDVAYYGADDAIRRFEFSSETHLSDFFVGTLGAGGPPLDLELLADGGLLALSAAASRQVVTWLDSTGTVTDTVTAFDLPGGPHQVRRIALDLELERFYYYSAGSDEAGVDAVIGHYNVDGSGGSYWPVAIPTYPGPDTAFTWLWMAVVPPPPGWRVGSIGAPVS